MKSADKAHGTLTIGLMVSLVMAVVILLTIPGIYILLSLAPVVVAYFAAVAQWQPVLEGEAISRAYRSAYDTERIWISIRLGEVNVKEDDVILNWTNDEFVKAVVRLWRSAGFPKIANEREYHYMKGSGFIVETAASSDGMDKVTYNDIELDLLPYPDSRGAN